MSEFQENLINIVKFKADVTSMQKTLTNFVNKYSSFTIKVDNKLESSLNNFITRLENTLNNFKNININTDKIQKSFNIETYAEKKLINSMYPSKLEQAKTQLLIEREKLINKNKELINQGQINKNRYVGQQSYQVTKNLAIKGEGLDIKNENEKLKGVILQQRINSNKQKEEYYSQRAIEIQKKYNNTFSQISSYLARGLIIYHSIEKFIIPSIQQGDLFYKTTQYQLQRTYGIQPEQSKNITNTIYRDLINFSNQLGVNSQAVLSNYSRFIGTRIKGTSYEEQNEMYKNLIRYSSNIGVYGDDLRRFLIALTQMTSRGKLVGQEINQMVNANIPGVREMLKKALGVNSLENLNMDMGTIWKRLNNYIINDLKSIGTIEETLSQKIERLKNNIKNIIVGITENQTFQASINGLIKMMNVLAIAINKLSDVIVKVGLVYGMSKIISGISQFTSKNIIGDLSFSQLRRIALLKGNDFRDLSSLNKLGFLYQNGLLNTSNIGIMGKRLFTNLTTSPYTYAVASGILSSIQGSLLNNNIIQEDSPVNSLMNVGRSALKGAMYGSFIPVVGPVVGAISGALFGIYQEVKKSNDIQNERKEYELSKDSNLRFDYSKVHFTSEIIRDYELVGYKGSQI